jgi:hypothetical protein
LSKTTTADYTWIERIFRKKTNTYTGGLEDAVMGLAGPDFYDDHEIFKTYLAHRDRRDSPNDILEKPVLLELLGNLNGKRILDLGCGDASIGREALQRGCVAYVGVEGSHNMAALASKT